jgi:lipid-A-disaccharide synthase
MAEQVKPIVKLAAGEAPRFAMVAGEASGDLLASLMMSGLINNWPAAQMFGIGGPKMAEAGFQAWWPADKLSVRGYVEVLRHYREIVSIRQQLFERLLRQPPSVFIGVDAPDFNLDLAAKLKRNRIPTVQFVCPSIWAWRPERIEKIKKSVDHVLCLFPFEPDLLRRNGIDATYVGHPLAQAIPMQIDRQSACLALGLDPQKQVLAVLPGSRRSEIQYLLRRFLQTAQQVRQARPAIQVVLPAMPVLRDFILSEIDAAGGLPGLRLLEGQSHQALAACDVCLVASGTATLEAALFKRPMVIAYNMHPVSWWMMKRKKLQPWVGLPNILCEEFVVPELLQDQATPHRLSEALIAWLESPSRTEALKKRFTQLHQRLLQNTPQLCAHAIEKILAS